MTAAPATAVPVLPGTRRRAWTVEEYHRMREAGILGEHDRVELLDGEVVAKVPIGSRHAGCVKRLNRTFVRLAGDRYVIGVQDPVVLDRSEPEPDVAVLRWRDDLYATAHPRAADVVLLVEVADTSAAEDRRRKLPLYARAGIAEVWLVDLDADAVLRHREPSPDGYRAVDVVRDGALAPDGAPDLAVAVADVLDR